MSISTPGGPERRPTVVSTGKKPAAGRPASGAKAGAGKPAGGARPAAGGKGPRKPIAPVKVSQGRAWGPIALSSPWACSPPDHRVRRLGLLQGSKPWDDRANAIDGIVTARQGPHRAATTSRALKYAAAAVAIARDAWQNCMGDVCDAPIAEHAVHNWARRSGSPTARPPRRPGQPREGAARRSDVSPFEGWTSRSQPAWGYQLKVDNAGDDRIDEFIKTLKVNASIEGPTALCNQGVTATGTTLKLPSAAMGAMTARDRGRHDETPAVTVAGCHPRRAHVVAAAVVVGLLLGYAEAADAHHDPSGTPPARQASPGHDQHTPGPVEIGDRLPAGHRLRCAIGGDIAPAGRLTRRMRPGCARGAGPDRFAAPIALDATAPGWSNG
jgi:hypothetical protein